MDAPTNPFGQFGHDAQPPGPEPSPDRPARRGPLHAVTRTVSKAWTDGIVRQSASAAFWQALSLAPLLLVLLGSLGYVAGLFGQNTVALVRREILEFSGTIFTSRVVSQIIEPTVEEVLSQGRASIVSVGFVISLWAGSSALANLVDAITASHGQHKIRNPVWQRIFSLLLYLVSLVGLVLMLPLLAIGPQVLPEFFPPSARPTVDQLVQILYYPVLGVLLVLGLASLYRVALPRKYPWHRGLPGAVLAMIVFLVSSLGLRLYIQWLTSTGYTYGALATPIAFLLFSFFIAMAVILGAQFNNTLLEMWPARTPRAELRRQRRGQRERTARARIEAARAAWQRPADRDAAPERGDPSHNPARSGSAVTRARLRGLPRANRLLRSVRR